LVVNFKIRNDIKNVVSDFVFASFKVLEFGIYLLEFPLSFGIWDLKIGIYLIKRIIFGIWNLFFGFSANCVNNLSALYGILTDI